MKTKKFRVVKSGQTTDGRNVPAEHIRQMAANYSPAKYGARVNLEHIKSYSPDSIFKMYGDVISLSVEEEGEDVYLVAEILPTPELVALSKSRQKVHFSIEYDAKFAGTDEAYLVGIACTDNPSSLGTSYMQFCQTNPAASPLTARKKSATSVFSTAELAGSFDDADADPATAPAADPVAVATLSVFEKLSAMFSGERPAPSSLACKKTPKSYQPCPSASRASSKRY